MTDKFEILVVCIGNVCRSPLAEHLLRRQLQRVVPGRADWIEVSSAGTRALAGHPMETMAAHELTLLGGEPWDHLASQLTLARVERAGLVLTATRLLRSRVLEEAPRALRRTFAIREFAALVGHGGPSAGPVQAAQGLDHLVARAAATRGAIPHGDYDVPDPLGKPRAFHHDVVAMLDDDCTRIVHGLARAITGSRFNPVTPW